MRAAVVLLALTLIAAMPAIAEAGIAENQSKCPAGTDKNGACIDDLAEAIHGVLTNEQTAAMKKAEEAQDCNHADLASTQTDAVEAMANCKITLMQNVIEPAGE